MHEAYSLFIIIQVQLFDGVSETKMNLPIIYDDDDMGDE